MLKNRLSLLFILSGISLFSTVQVATVSADFLDEINNEVIEKSDVASSVQKTKDSNSKELIESDSNVKEKDVEEKDPNETPQKEQASSGTETNNLPSTRNGLKLATIDITGVDSELKKNIELHMPVTIPECRADKAEIKQFFTTVKKHLRKASRALGYYDAVFRSGGKIVNGCWKLRLRITPGKPVKIVSQQYQVVGIGKNEKLFKDILAELPYKVGDTLNHSKYTEFKTKLSEAAQTLGYFDAEFEKHAITISPTTYQAKIALVLNTKERYRYGKVTIDQKILSDRKMKNYIIIKSGQPYSTEDLLRQQQILQRSGYYKLIKIDALHQQAENNRVPVLIQLERKKRNAYTFRVGYGSDTGPRISAEMNRRWTGSKGRKLNLKAQYSEKLSGIAAQLVVPRNNPDDDSVIYTAKWEHDTKNDVESNSYEIDGLFTRKLKNDWIQTASLGYLFDRTQDPGKPANYSNLLLFGVGLEKTKADNILFPQDGWHVKFELKGAHEALLSDQSILQFRASAKRIKQLGKGKIVARADMGSTLSGDFINFPKSLRFFAGGGNSVRGYGFEELGNKDGDDVIGGPQLFTSSIEYQHPVYEGWSAAAFVDAGNSFDDWNDPQLELGYGVGARWRSPVGPVRIDLGFPEGGNLGDFKLYLNVGSEL